MKVLNPRCKLAWFLDAKRNGNFKFEYIPPSKRNVKSIYSMYLRPDNLKVIVSPS